MLPWVALREDVWPLDGIREWQVIFWMAVILWSAGLSMSEGKPDPEYSLKQEELGENRREQEKDKRERGERKERYTGRREQEKEAFKRRREKKREITVRMKWKRRESKCWVTFRPGIFVFMLSVDFHEFNVGSFSRC